MRHASIPSRHYQNDCRLLADYCATPLAVPDLAWFKIRRFWVTQASGVALPVKAGLVSNAM
jgi:type II secretory pathway component PulL